MTEPGLGQRLQASFAQFGKLPALEGADRRFSFEELDRQSNALAAALRAAGVRAGDIVPMLMARTPTLVIAQLAVIRLGAAYAPIDLASPALRQQQMLAQLAPRLLVIDGAAPGSVVGDYQTFDATLSQNAPATGESIWTEQSDDALAYVMFTSGTTGVPKGVLIPHAGIIRLVCDAEFANIQIGSRWAMMASPAFDASTLEMWAPLLNGGCCVVQETTRPSIDDLADFLVHKEISDGFITSALFNAIVDDRIDAFRNSRQLIVGGERVSPHHAARVLATYPDVHLVNGYGPTENTTFTCTHRITLHDTQSAAGIPIGLPLKGTTVRIGAESAEPREGELLCAGKGVAHGYYNDPELTAKKFVNIDGQTWYRTGDLVRRNAHDVFEYIGRTDRQIKLQGHRIELDEIERALDQCPGIANCAVLVRGDTADSRYLVACYTTAENAGPTEPSIDAWLRAQLPPAAVPSALVKLERMPLGRTGKVDYAAIEALLANTASTESAHPTGNSETERRLITIWSELFPNVTINRDSAFDAVGGNSLIAIRLSAKARRAFGRDLTPIAVLRTPLLSEQARLIDRAPPYFSEPELSSATASDIPLTQVQRSIIAASQLDNSQAAFLVHTPLHFAGPAALPQLRTAFESLAARHQSLRITIRYAGEEPAAMIRAELPDAWWTERETLNSAPEPFAWPDPILNTINRTLDLHAGVMRVDVWPIADGSTLVIWTVHHLAVDESSIDRCLADLDVLMRQESLPAVYGSPAGFAAFEKAATDWDALRTWPSIFVDALHGHAAPLPRAPGLGNETPVFIPSALSAHVLSTTASRGETPFALMLVAFGAAIQEVFGRAHRFVSTPFSRRAEAEFLEPVGCLLDLRPIEAGALDNEPVSTTLRRVTQELRELQRDSFFPHRAVEDAVRRRDMHVARHLDMFGFTWRHDPSRTIALGAQSARILRVPQQGARFGVTLHVWTQDGSLHSSVEAIDEAFADGRAKQVGDTFVRLLGEFVNTAPDAAGLHARPLVERAPSAISTGEKVSRVDFVQILRRLWSEYLKVQPESVSPGSNFLQLGGNSLKAMRMVAAVRRECGRSIDVGAFLSHPTFGELCVLVETAQARVPDCCTILGDANAPQLVIMLPGNFSTPVGSYRLADEVQRRLGPTCAVVIIDLESMLLRVDPDGLAEFVVERSAQAVNELGAHRVIAVSGFSNGGLLALQLVDRLQMPHVPVWLIDTYAPFSRAQNFAQFVVRPRIRRLLQNKTAARVFRTHVRAPSETSEARETAAEQIRKTAHARLERDWNVRAANEIVLVQAHKTAEIIALLTRRNSNGFNTPTFGGWSARAFNAWHAELMQEMAPIVAQFLVESLATQHA